MGHVVAWGVSWFGYPFIVLFFLLAVHSFFSFGMRAWALASLLSGEEGALTYVFSFASRSYVYLFWVFVLGFGRTYFAVLSLSVCGCCC